MTPDAFGSFRIVRQVGAGPLGPAFLAHQPDTDCQVAIKVLSLGLRDDRQHQLLARLEALVSAPLLHFNIASPLAAGISGAFVYFAQELATGDSLELLLRDRLVVRPAEVARLTTEIAAALDAAAAAGIVHGRLNPRDVIVSQHGLRLTGLGIAQALEHVEVVTPPREPYAAPERLAEAHWGPRADVFSLAAMMFELLWGYSITGREEPAVEGIEPLPGADLRLLRRTFARALAVNPDDRFDTAGDFARAIQIACAPGLYLAGTSGRKAPSLSDAQPAATPVPALKKVRIAESSPMAAPEPPLEPETTFDTAAEITDETVTEDGAPTAIDHLIDAIEANLIEESRRTTRAATAGPVAMDLVQTSHLEQDEVETAATQDLEDLQDAAPAADTLVAAGTPRRYSMWWPFIIGPALGAAIGYGLVPTLDHFRGDRFTGREIRRQAPTPARGSSPYAALSQRMMPAIADVTPIQPFNDRGSLSE